MRQVQGDLALRQAVVLQPLADQLRKIGELEFMHVHVVAFGAHARGVHGPIDELAVARSRDQHGAAPGHERPAQIVQGALAGAEIGVETEFARVLGDPFAAGLEIDGQHRDSLAEVQETEAPDALTTGAHFSVSSVVNRANSSGVLATGSAACEVSCALTLGSARALAISC